MQIDEKVDSVVNEVEHENEGQSVTSEDFDEVQENYSGMPLDIIDDVSGSYFEDIIILHV